MLFLRTSSVSKLYVTSTVGAIESTTIILLSLSTVTELPAMSVALKISLPLYCGSISNLPSASTTANVSPPSKLYSYPAMPERLSVALIVTLSVSFLMLKISSQIVGSSYSTLISVGAVTSILTAIEYGSESLPA